MKKLQWRDRTEAKPHHFAKRTGWLYVSERFCSFHSHKPALDGNNSHVQNVPTKLIRRLLAKMDYENLKFPRYKEKK